MPFFLLVFLLLIALAAANGANDGSKGIATLAGSGVTGYRTAIIWGVFTTLAGALVSGLFAERMMNLFTSGIVSANPTPAFTLAMICGTVGWLAIATLTRLPVSTTHAIIGSLLGAGLLFAPNAIAWRSLTPRLVGPLLLSIAVSYLLSAHREGLLTDVPTAFLVGVGANFGLPHVDDARFHGSHCGRRRQADRAT